MITLRLWQALHTPFVAHPLYYLRGLSKPSDDGLQLISKLEQQARYIGLGFIILCIFLMIRFGAFAAALLIIGLPIVTLSLGIPLMLLLIGTVYGFVSALSIASVISREQYQGRLQLLAITPYGMGGAIWAFGSITVQNSPMLRRIRVTAKPTYFTMLTIIFFPVVLLILPSITNPSYHGLQQSMNEAVGIVVFVIFTGTDLLQSGNTGCLVGMLVPVMSNSTAQVMGRAIVMFSLLHFGLYIICGLFCLTVLPLLATSNSSYYILCLLTICICREVMIFGLWRILVWKLDASYDELNTFARIGIRREKHA